MRQKHINIYSLFDEMIDDVEYLKKSTILLKKNNQ